MEWRYIGGGQSCCRVRGHRQDGGWAVSRGARRRGGWEEGTWLGVSLCDDAVSQWDVVADVVGQRGGGALPVSVGAALKHGHGDERGWVRGGNNKIVEARASMGRRPRDTAMQDRRRRADSRTLLRKPDGALGWRGRYGGDGAPRLADACTVGAATA